MKKFILSACLTAMTAATVFANPTPKEIQDEFQLPIAEITSSTTFADVEHLRGRLQELSKLHSSESEFLEKFELGYPSLYPTYRKYITDIEALKFFSQKDGRIKRFIKGTLGFIKRHKIISFITFTALLAYTVYGAACLCTTLYPEVNTAYAGYMNSQIGGQQSTAYTQPLLAAWEKLEKDPDTAAQAMCVKLAHKILGAYTSCGKMLAPYLALITGTQSYKNTVNWVGNTASFVYKGACQLAAPSIQLAHKKFMTNVWPLYKKLTIAMVSYLEQHRIRNWRWCNPWSWPILTHDLTDELGTELAAMNTKWYNPLSWRVPNGKEWMTWANENFVEKGLSWLNTKSKAPGWYNPLSWCSHPSIKDLTPWCRNS
jgi:hypothetical protein